MRGQREKPRRITMILSLLLLLCSGCRPPSQPPDSPQSADLKTLESRMTTLFSALEMHAHDHSLSYPDGLSALQPRYIETIPRDPIGGQPIAYQKTEHGYLLEARGDYSGLGAATGYPKMDQDGFFALKATDFPRDGAPLTL